MHTTTDNYFRTKELSLKKAQALGAIHGTIPTFRTHQFPLFVSRFRQGNRSASYMKPCEEYRQHGKLLELNKYSVLARATTDPCVPSIVLLRHRRISNIQVQSTSFTFRTDTRLITSRATVLLLRDAAASSSALPQYSTLNFYISSARKAISIHEVTPAETSHTTKRPECAVTRGSCLGIDRAPSPSVLQLATRASPSPVTATSPAAFLPGPLVFPGEVNVAI